MLASLSSLSSLLVVTVVTVVTIVTVVTSLAEVTTRIVEERVSNCSDGQIWADGLAVAFFRVLSLITN